MLKALSSHFDDININDYYYKIFKASADSFELNVQYGSKAESVKEFIQDYTHDVRKAIEKNVFCEFLLDSPKEQRHEHKALLDIAFNEALNKKEKRIDFYLQSYSEEKSDKTKSIYCDESIIELINKTITKNGIQLNILNRLTYPEEEISSNCYHPLIKYINENHKDKINVSIYIKQKYSSCDCKYAIIGDNTVEFRAKNKAVVGFNAQENVLEIRKAFDKLFESANTFELSS